MSSCLQFYPKLFKKIRSKNYIIKNIVFKIINFTSSVQNKIKATDYVGGKNVFFCYKTLFYVNKQGNYYLFRINFQMGIQHCEASEDMDLV